MFPHLNGLGIHDPSQIERYSLRQEAQKDVLKIYFKKQKGELFAKSVKFKYPRQKKAFWLTVEVINIKRSQKSTAT